jgi:hypothetical protein
VAYFGVQRISVPSECLLRSANRSYSAERRRNTHSRNETPRIDHLSRSQRLSVFGPGFSVPGRTRPLQRFRPALVAEAPLVASAKLTVARLAGLPERTNAKDAACLRALLNHVEKRQHARGSCAAIIEPVVWGPPRRAEVASDFAATQIGPCHKIADKLSSIDNERC